MEWLRFVLACMAWFVLVLQTTLDNQFWSTHSARQGYGRLTLNLISCTQ